MKHTADFTCHSDTMLDSELIELVDQERHCLAEILAYLAEVDERRSYRRAGYSSMCGYVTGKLGYPEDAAKSRIRAARLLRRFAAIGPLVATGALHLSGLRLLAPRLDEDNHAELLAAASFKSKRQIEELLAARFGGTGELDLVVPVAEAKTEPEAESEPEPEPETLAEPETRHDAAAPEPVWGTRPVSAQSYSLSCTISRACHDKLVEARDLLRHALPSGDAGAIVERALDLLVDSLRKRKFAATEAPRKTSTEPQRGNFAISAPVKRAVVERDGYRCAYVSPDGKRCDETGWLEFHHVDPVGKCTSPEPTPETVKLYCRAHNQYAAELDFGRAHMDRARSAAPAPGSTPAPVIDHREQPDTPVPITAALKADAMLALCQSGFKRREAQRAVTASLAHVPPTCSLVELVRQSFRCCRTG